MSALPDGTRPPPPHYTVTSKSLSVEHKTEQDNPDKEKSRRKDSKNYLLGVLYHLESVAPDSRTNNQLTRALVVIFVLMSCTKYFRFNQCVIFLMPQQNHHQPWNFPNQPGASRFPPNMAEIRLPAFSPHQISS